MLSTHAQKRYEAFVKWQDCIAESNRERNEIKGGFFPMSSAGGCARKLAFLYLDKPRPPTPARTKRVFEHGSMFEDQVRRIIRDNPYGIRLDCPELQVTNDDPPMIGHIDGLIWCDSLNNLVTLINGGIPNVSKNEADWSQHHLELKTQAEYSFRNIVKSGIIVASPDYIAQQQCYLHALKDINDTYFLIENKNTNYVIGQYVPYDPIKYVEVETRIRLIHELILHDELPEIEYEEKTHYPCSWSNNSKETNYCDYYKLCWEET